MKNNYRAYVQQYLEIFEPLFEAARETSEFNLILTLLAIRGVSDAGWEPYENTEQVVEDIYKQQNKFRHSVRGNINLWLYAHLIECSEHYELVANLLNTTLGKDYIIANHKSKQPRYQNLKIEQKIQRLEKIAKNTSFANVSEPFKDAFDTRLRNAIYHADYSFKGGDVTIMGDGGFPTIYSQQQILDYINKANALHEVLKKLSAHYVGMYHEPTIIDSSDSFGGGKPMKMTLIIRKNHGVIGVKGLSNNTDAGKPFEVSLFKCLPYERKLISNGETLLPPNKIERMNKIADKLPRRMASLFTKKFGNSLTKAD